jgi:GT2 family glycosyltransferase
MAVKGSRAEHPSANATPEAPIKVTIIDVEDGVVDVSAEHPNGGYYKGLWALLRIGGEPRALIKRSFDGEPAVQIDGRSLLDDLGVGEPPSVPTVLPDPPPSMSVVVPTMFIRDEELRNCLKAIFALDYPAFEVILVYTAKEDIEPPEWLAEFDVQLLRESYPGLSAARNRGLNAATGTIAAFTDDDTEVDPGWLTAIAHRLATHPDEVGLTGLVLPRDVETSAQLAFEQYYRPDGPEIIEPMSYRLASPRDPRHPFRAAMVEGRDETGKHVRSFSLYEGGRFGGGNNMAMYSDVLREAGGFDVRLGGGSLALAGEDIEVYSRLAWRGYHLGFVPAALVLHVHRRDDDSLRHQIEGYGVGLSATAMALAVDDPRHLAAIAATVPRATRLLGQNFWRKLRTSPPPGPDENETSSVAGLARVEIRGMLRGPAAYLRSWWRVRQSDGP